MSPLHIRILKWVSHSRTSWGSLVDYFCQPGSGTTEKILRDALQQLEERNMLEKRPHNVPWEGRTAGLPHIIEAWVLTDKARQYLTDLTLQKKAKASDQ